MKTDEIRAVDGGEDLLFRLEAAVSESCYYFPTVVLFVTILGVDGLKAAITHLENAGADKMDRGHMSKVYLIAAEIRDTVRVGVAL